MSDYDKDDLEVEPFDERYYDSEFDRDYCAPDENSQRDESPRPALEHSFLVHFNNCEGTERMREVRAYSAEQAAQRLARDIDETVWVTHVEKVEPNEISTNC